MTFKFNDNITKKKMNFLNQNSSSSFDVQIDKPEMEVICIVENLNLSGIYLESKSTFVLKIGSTL